MSYADVTILDYRPGESPDLDDSLAHLAYEVVTGWPDQRPISAGLVRSRLQAPDSAPPTILALRRTHRGLLVGAAALRHPDGLGSRGRLWGPVVHPDHQYRGIGRTLFAALPTGILCTSAEIPATRARGTEFYASAGWRAGEPHQLLKRDLPPPSSVIRMPATIGPHDGRDLTTELARLYAQNRPRHSPATAAGTFTRWTRDERFAPRHLWMATQAGRLLGAALVYPLEHTAPNEPREALLADLLVQAAAEIGADEIRLALSSAALNSAYLVGAQVARCVADTCMDPHGVLQKRLGFAIVDNLLMYLSP
ncbi:hypothetical protein GCM10023205_78960 [Yinghuangia aomiensis]|uniref:N-acetyltransferase domain-containing protein n=1 Tax=Yinghuangia aomiensis TaxID=676205 RepID=A0ABP9IC38_9ACTN